MTGVIYICPIASQVAAVKEQSDKQAVGGQDPLHSGDLPVGQGISCLGQQPTIRQKVAGVQNFRHLQLLGDWSCGVVTRGLLVQRFSNLFAAGLTVLKGHLGLLVGRADVNGDLHRLGRLGPIRAPAASGRFEGTSRRS